MAEIILRELKLEELLKGRERLDKLECALKLHLEFLASLPPGWLAKTSGDVGLLNDAYIASKDAGVEIPSKRL